MFVPQIMKCLRDRYSFYFEMTVFTFRYSLRLLLLTKLLKLVCVHQFIFFVGFKIELEFFWQWSPDMCLISYPLQNLQGCHHHASNALIFPFLFQLSMYFSIKVKEPLAASAVILQKNSGENYHRSIIVIKTKFSSKTRKKNAHHFLPHPSQSLASQIVFTF